MNECADCCLVYMDDLLVFSETQEKYLQYVTRVFAALAKAKLKVKMAKCVFVSFAPIAIYTCVCMCVRVCVKVRSHTYVYLDLLRTYTNANDVEGGARQQNNRHPRL